MKSVILKYNKFDGVWHFTDRSNLELIKEHGLLSLAELERRGISIPAPSGNEWSHDADKIKNLHEYVHLAFIDEHPMEYCAREDGRIKDPIWLKIDVSIILGENVLFCSDVSNKTGVNILTSEQAKGHIDFDVLFTYMDWRDPMVQSRRQNAKKSEILVPNMIPVDKILMYKNG
ncbi:MAG: DarT ssDNA thymidine ADP-ribosyltransferase family protein [Methylococcales bacterium]